MLVQEMKTNQLVDVFQCQNKTFLEPISVQMDQKICMIFLKISELFHMAGSRIMTDYDQESTYFKANCHSDNTDVILDLTLQMSLEKRSHLFEYPSEMLEKYGLENEDQLTFNDYILKTAFGNNALGLPLLGNNENRQNLNADIMDSFYDQTFSFDKIFVVAGAVKDPNMFALQLEQKLNNFKLNKSSSKRDKQQYFGGQNFIKDENEELQVGLFFKSVPWSNHQISNFNVITTILGNSQSFSTGGPGKGMHSRTTKNMLNKHYFINSAGGINMHFSDQGLFGMQCSGPAQDGRSIIREIIRELKKLSIPIQDIELNRAKNILKSNIFMILERKQDRLEEAVKNVKMLGALEFPHYEQSIDKITSQMINEQIKSLLNSPPTYVVQGKIPNNMPSLQDLKQLIDSNIHF